MRRSAERILDEYLTAAAQTGDRMAFNQLAKRWQPKLLAHACRLIGDPEQARDIVQDGWGDIVKGLPRLKDTAMFPAWAYRIVTRRTADVIRRKQRQRKLNSAYANEPKAGTGAAQIESRADVSHVHRAMRRLPPEQRATVALFYREGLSVVEIAAALSVPAGTVKTRLMHARRKLRLAVEGEHENGKK